MKSEQIVAKNWEYGWDEETEMQVSSFVVRIWTQPKAAEPEVRGWIEHVQSGERIAFHGWTRMLAVMAAHLPTTLHKSGESRNLLKCWRSYVSEYFMRRKKDRVDYGPT